jgi:hypothetical protein
MPRTVLSSLAAAAAATAMLVSLAGPAEAYKCKSAFTQAEAIHKLRFKRGFGKELLVGEGQRRLRLALVGVEDSRREVRHL